HFIAEAQIKNGGSTPAYGVQSNIRVNVLPYPLDRPIEQYSRTSLPPPTTPNEAFIFGDMLLFVPNDQEFAYDYQNFIGTAGRERLYVWGEVNYTDAFGSPHTLYFCYRFAKETLTSQYEYCDHYNGESPH